MGALTGDFRKIKTTISLISAFESREYGRNDEVVIWQGSTVLLLNNYQASLYLNCNSRTFVVMRLASEKQYARLHGMGLTFIKRETKTRLWAFALHDLVE